MSDEIKPCPFCGSHPIFPKSSEVYGTCYDFSCEGCGIPHISIQIIDMFDFPERNDVHESWSNSDMKYGDKYIEVARLEAINEWNKRAT